MQWCVWQLHEREGGARGRRLIRLLVHEGLGPRHKAAARIHRRAQLVHGVGARHEREGVAALLLLAAAAAAAAREGLGRACARLEQPA